MIIYGQLGHNEQSIQSRNGVIFLSTLIPFFQLASGVSLIFPEERNVVMREQSWGMYHIFAYYLAKILSLFPVVFIFMSIFVITIYFAIKLNTNDASHFFIFYSFGVLFTYCWIGVGMFVGVAVKTGDEAIDISKLKCNLLV